MSCVRLHAKKLVPEKTCTILTDTFASFWHKITCTSFCYKFLEHRSPAFVLSTEFLAPLYTVCIVQNVTFAHDCDEFWATCSQFLLHD